MLFSRQRNDDDESAVIGEKGQIVFCEVHGSRLVKKKEEVYQTNKLK
jgi:hypothetical protein